MKAAKRDGFASRRVTTNQVGIHPELEAIVRKHRTSEFLKPISRHTLEAFEQVRSRLERLRRPLILDSGCGKGESTIRLAQEFCDHVVVGLDKSLHRLLKNPYFGRDHPENLLLLRADIFDFWRLCARHGQIVQRHYIFYPNPWPKKRHVKRRIHGHPAFPDLLRISRYLEVRSNWKLYLEEFAQAVFWITGLRFQVQSLDIEEPITSFERKYLWSGHELFRLEILLPP